MSYEHVKYAVDGHVGILTLNRPERLNAMNALLRHELLAVIDAVHADDNVRALLRLVPEAELMSAALALANEMTQWPPVALRASKRVLQHSMESALEDALHYELASLALGRKAVNDNKESRAALLEKRAPKYTGT